MPIALDEAARRARRVIQAAAKEPGALEEFIAAAIQASANDAADAKAAQVAEIVAHYDALLSICVQITEAVEKVAAARAIAILNKGGA